MKKKQRWVMGDIHGGYLAMMDILQQVNFDYEYDELICLGDYCDGWSQTPEVIEELMKIKNLIYIMGNHDDWFIKFTTKAITSFHQQDEMRSWLHHGGTSTLDAYSKFDSDYKLKHIEFLRRAKNFYIDEHNNLFVHAGYEKHILPGVFDFSTNEYARQDLFWNRDFWNDAYSGKKIGYEFNHVYIGHTPTLNYPNGRQEHLKPMTRGNVTNVDTGAAFTGRLSMIDLDTKEVFQSSKKVMDFYMTERGRN